MHIHNLSSAELVARLQKLVQTERKITHLILDCINEIEIRKLHLEQGYSSMYDFLTLKMGYTPASAQRRLESARLIRQMPEETKTEIHQKIESGSLQLSHLSMLQKYSREKQKTSGEVVSLKQKQEILLQLENKSLEQSQVVIAKSLDLEVLETKFHSSRHHKDESVTLTMTFSKEEMEILKQVRDLKSHATGSIEIKDVLMHLAKKELKQPVRISKTLSGKTSVGANTGAGLSEEPFGKTLCCQFKDPISNKVCNSRLFLTIDHIMPRWAGGTDDPSNLRILCKNHNVFRYHKQSGLKSLPLRR